VTVMTYFKTIHKAAEPQLLKAIVRTAREECAHATWAELEPVLAEAWEDLRGADAAPWDLVADEVHEASIASVWDRPH
jgi:hypothetical protein